MVFDLSAEFHGTSINKALLSVPDWTNQVVRVLLQFREEQIAVTGDVQFLLLKDSNSSKVIVDHEMRDHVFKLYSRENCSR